MRNIRSQAGFGHLTLVLLVVVVAVVGFAGYTVWQAGQDKTSNTSTSQQATVPAKIETKADLQKTGDFLDQTASALDNDLNPSSLDSSIDQLL